jgi:hypothetical protein
MKDFVLDRSSLTRADRIKLRLRLKAKAAITWAIVQLTRLWDVI